MRFGGQEQGPMAAKQAQARQETQRRQAWDAINRNDHQPSLSDADAPILDRAKLADWGRDPDPSIFVVFCSQHVAAAALRTSITE
eukprot:3969528-Pyramimonas_sp.AAC.1